MFGGTLSLFAFPKSLLSFGFTTPALNCIPHHEVSRHCETGRECLHCRVSPASQGFIFFLFFFLQAQSQQFRPSWFCVFANCPGKNKGFGPLNIPLCVVPSVLTCKFPARMWLICSFFVPVGRSCTLAAALEPGMRSHLNRQCVLTTLLLHNSPC